MSGKAQGLNKPPKPVDSAATILLRQHPDGKRTEILLVRRHIASSSFAGAFVFPGGHVDSQDTDAGLLEATSGLGPQQAAERLGEELSPKGALAFWVTAIRELFEEAGVLLARRASGGPVDFTNPQVALRFSESRRQLCQGEERFGSLVARENLRLELGALAYFSRWITPVTSPSRFDTRFFVALAPDNQEALHDDREVTDARWLSPEQALSEAATGEILLFPPTVRTLEELASIGTPEAILASARLRRVKPILPKVVTAKESPVILLPGDAAYEAAQPGEELPPASGPVQRMGMVNGTWRSLPARVA